MEITADFTCREAGWRLLPSGWRRSVITIQFFHRCWRCTCTETPLSSSAVKWRLNASAWPYINPPRGSVAYFLSCSRRSCALIGCGQTSVKPDGPAHHSMVGTSCSLTCLNTMAAAPHCVQNASVSTFFSPLTTHSNVSIFTDECPWVCRELLLCVLCDFHICSALLMQDFSALWNIFVLWCRW